MTGILKKWMVCAITLMVVLTGSCMAAQSLSQDPPMVISVSWSSPDPRYLRMHIEEWEKRPFTGTLINLSWPQTEAGSVQMPTPKDNLSWKSFQKKRFTPEMFEGAMKDLRETKFTRSKDNFLWVVSYLDESHFDWFDDEWWADILHNTESLARFTKEGGLKGIMLDCEEYGCPFWSWGGSRPEYALKSLKTYQGKSWEETRDQVRRRGRSFIKAVNQGFPGCTMWLLFGYSHIVGGTPDDVQDLSDGNFGLQAAFLDGMLEASDEKTIFIDGCEGAYRFEQPQEFKELRKIVTEKALKYTLVPEVYKKKMRVGFGLYLDMFNYTGSHPWYGDRPDDNYMTPARLEKALRNALKNSDGYVWLYSEYPSWWLDNPDAAFGKGVRTHENCHKWIDPVYWQAIERGMNYKLLEQSSAVKGSANIALGKPVNGKSGSALTDGDTDSFTPQAGYTFNYTVDLQGEYQINKVTMYWGGMGTSEDYINGWELNAELGNGESVNLASGECPNSKETTVSVNQKNVVKLQIIGKSSKNWICMGELGAFTSNRK